MSPGSDAVATLQTYLSTPSDVDAGHRAVHALMEARQWALAVKVWNQLLERGAVATRDLPLYGYCLVQAGALEQARTLATGLPDLLRDLGEEERRAIGETAHHVYSATVPRIFNGGWDGGETVLDLFLPNEPFGRRILGLTPLEQDDGPRPPRLEDAAVADFIQARMAAVACGAVRPPLADMQRSVSQQKLEGYRGRRVLVIFPEFYWPHGNSRAHPGGTYLEQSALEIGLDVRLIRSDDACAEWSRGKARMVADLTLIEQVIVEWRPDVVVYDNFGKAEAPAFARLVSDLRAEFGFKLVGLYADVWTAARVSDLADGAGSLDVAWFADVTLPTAGLAAVPNALGTTPYFPETPFVEAQRRVARTIPLGFIGGCAGGNYVRGIWIAEARRRGVDLLAEVGFPLDTRYEGVEGFADFLASCRTSLCICGRNTFQTALPGRVWEGIYAGSVLLADDCADLRQVLVPFAHYIPFRTLHELAYYAGFLERRADIRQAIADHALAFVRDYYSAVRVWTQVLDRAFGEGQAAGAR